MLFSVVAAALVAAGAAGAAYRPSPGLALDGPYRLSDGSVISLAVTPGGGMLYTDTRTGDLRQLTGNGTTVFRFGPAYLVPTPVRGTIHVKGKTLTLTTGGRTRPGRLLPLKRERVSFRGAGIRLVGKVTSPAAPGRHPGIVIVHGSESGDRDGYDLLVNFYSSLGYAVLTYDKRGAGDSGGTYQEYPSPGYVESLSGDALGALRALATRPYVDTGHLGLVGASQAGWIIPRVATRSPLVRFAVITAGPAMSVGEQGLYQGITGGGASSPTRAQIEQQLSGAQPSGFDPRPDLEKLAIPTLWLFGSEDKSVYTAQSVAILKALPSPPEIKVFTRAGHLVLDTPHGLTSELPRAHRFAPGYFATISGWLKSH
jgi:uncharacterized protein